ncbi:MAG TPA: thioredoxin domain-containing protein, partial [Longimicrobium sp.]|nr:thioredoxin domain-containing protein [Longimicrobium sp.]
GQRSGGEAPVTVVVFSDFQCPACRVLAQSLDVIRERHPGTVAVVYRHFPLPAHPFAPAAAQASECAARQGRFQAYHDELFRRQEAIGDTSWTAFARLAAVPDLRAFEACAADTAPVPAVQRDIEAARRLGVAVTPTLLINGRRFDGTPGVESLERHILNAR